MSCSAITSTAESNERSGGVVKSVWPLMRRSSLTSIRVPSFALRAGRFCITRRADYSAVRVAGNAKSRSAKHGRSFSRAGPPQATDPPLAGAASKASAGDLSPAAIEVTRQPQRQSGPQVHDDHAEDDDEHVRH